MLNILRFLASGFLLSRRPLVDRGFGLIYDVERNITWLKDANYARTVRRSPDGQMTWNDAMSWVRSLRYRGIDAWRLPTALNPDGSGPCTGHNCDRSEFGHLVLGAWAAAPNSVEYLNGDATAVYWMSTPASDTEAFAFEISVARQGTLKKNPFSTDDFVQVPLPGPVLSWPVHDGDVAALIVQRFFQFVITARSPRLN